MNSNNNGYYDETNVTERCIYVKVQCFLQDSFLAWEDIVGVMGPERGPHMNSLCNSNVTLVNAVSCSF